MKETLYAVYHLIRTKLIDLKRSFNLHLKQVDRLKLHQVIAAQIMDRLIVFHKKETLRMIPFNQDYYFSNNNLNNNNNRWVNNKKIVVLLQQVNPI